MAQHERLGGRCLYALCLRKDVQYTKKDTTTPCGILKNNQSEVSKTEKVHSHSTEDPHLRQMAQLASCQYSTVPLVYTTPAVS